MFERPAQWIQPGQYCQQYRKIQHLPYKGKKGNELTDMRTRCAQWEWQVLHVHMRMYCSCCGKQNIVCCQHHLVDFDWNYSRNNWPLMCWSYYTHSHTHIYTGWCTCIHAYLLCATTIEKLFEAAWISPVGFFPIVPYMAALKSAIVCVCVCALCWDFTLTRSTCCMQQRNYCLAS